nr:hypothetical protein [Polyangiaceae bacterium]
MTADLNERLMRGDLPDDPKAIATPVNEAAKRASAVRSIERAPFSRGDHVELADRLVAKLRAESPTTFSDGLFYQYAPDRGVFDAFTGAKLSQNVQRFAGTAVKGEKKPLRLKASDIAGTVKLASDQIADIDFFATARRGVAFASSFVEVTSEKITQHEHSPDHRARFAYDFGYLRDAEPAALLEFFESSFRDDTDKQQKIDLLQEYLGISLLGLATRYQRAIVTLGEGSNGKGVISSIAEKCMPPGSVCSIPPQDI